MLMKSGDFQYYYRLWVEKSKSKDNEEDELVPDTIVQPAVPLSSSFYKELVRKTPGGFKCYELYTLYLGLVSVNMVASNARGLIQLLKTNTVPQTVNYQNASK